LLINGLGANLTMWNSLVSLFTDREVIVFDQPGMGRSKPTPRPRRVSALADMLALLLDELERPIVDVLGYSLGGVLAQELALRHRRCARRLVLAATTAGLPSIGPPPRMFWMLLDKRRYIDRATAERTLAVLAGGRTAREAEVAAAAVTRRLADPPSRLGLRRQLFAVAGWSGQRRLPRLRVPTLIIQGDDDPLIGLHNARRLAALIPGARLEIIPGAGHLFLFDEPERAVPVVRAFLDA
jgi:pimeloyl-ACP methyl ester carboxylesterase